MKIDYEASIQTKYSIEVCGFKITVCDKVYEPSDDTWLLLDVINRDKGEYSVAIDIGTGCGVLAACLHEKAGYVIAIDLSPYAVKCAYRNLKVLPHLVDVVQCDNLTCLRRLRNALIVYNTPYLPVDDTRTLGVEGLAWSGGVKEAVKTAEMICGWDVKAYVLVSSLSPAAIFEQVLKRLGCVWRVVMSKKLFFEELKVYEVSCPSLPKHADISNVLNDDKIGASLGTKAGTKTIGT